MPKSAEPKESKEPTVTAYCVKCRTKREMKNPKAATMKNGKGAKTGRTAREPRQDSARCATPRFFG